MTKKLELFGLAGDSALSGVRRIAGVSVTLGPEGAIPSLSGTLIPRGDPNITFFGGFQKQLGPTYPRYNYDTTTNITDDSGLRGIGGRFAFSTNAQKFEFLLYNAGSPAQFTITVDGKVVDGATISGIIPLRHLIACTR